MKFPFNAQQNTPWTINKNNNTNPCTHTHALWVNDLEDYSPNVIKHEKHNPLIDRKKNGNQFFQRLCETCHNITWILLCHVLLCKIEMSHG